MPGGLWVAVELLASTEGSWLSHGLWPAAVSAGTGPSPGMIVIGLIGGHRRLGGSAASSGRLQRWQLRGVREFRRKITRSVLSCLSRCLGVVGSGQPSSGWVDIKFLPPLEAVAMRAVTECSE